MSLFPNPVESTDADMLCRPEDTSSIYHIVRFVEEYGSKIAKDFHTNKEMIPITIYRNDPETQIQQFATICFQRIDSIPTLSAKYEEENLRELEKALLAIIGTDPLMKLFIAADTLELFNKYYPTHHIIHICLWSVGQRKAIQILRAKFPADYKFKFQGGKPTNFGSTMAAVVDSAGKAARLATVTKVVGRLEYDSDNKNVRRTRTVSFNHNKDPVLNIDGFDYRTKDELLANQHLKEFIIDSGADISITNRKELIDNLVESDDDDGGTHRHVCGGRGTITVGGITLTCLWAPSLQVSVVSTKETYGSHESVLFLHDGRKYTTDSASNTLNLIHVPNDDTAYRVSYLGVRAMKSLGQSDAQHKVVASNDHQIKPIVQTYKIRFTSLQNKQVPNDDTAYMVPYLGVKVMKSLDQSDAQHKVVASNDHRIKRIVQTYKIRFTALQNKRDNMNGLFVHVNYGHPKESIIRRICEREGVSFTSTDGEEIRNCVVCLSDKGRAVSHNEGATYKATQRLYRLHMDSMEFGKSKFATIITKEYSSYVWASYAKDKQTLRLQTERILQEINRLFSDRRISFITKDNRTGLPSQGFFESLGIRQDKIPPYTPQFYGTAKRMNGVLKVKLLSILQGATSNDFWQELQKQAAVHHAVFLQNLTPNGRQQVPKELLYNVKLSNSNRRPIFENDVIVHFSKAQRFPEPKLQDQDIRGIYLGSETGNGAVHNIWINFKSPVEKIKVLRVCNISFNNEFENMKEAEGEIETIAAMVKSQERLDAQIARQYPNVVLVQI